MFIIKNMDDHTLALSLIRAKELQLDIEFIKILEKELSERQKNEKIATQHT
jgi:hypothetical protein